MSIVTKTGDDGTTGLVGGGRTRKDDVLMHAVGDVDELNAALGLAAAQEDLPDVMRRGLIRIQNELFTLGADLATPHGSTASKKRITTAHVGGLESWIADCESSLPPLQQFILPSGSRTGSLLHLARTICRR